MTEQHTETGSEESTNDETDSDEWVDGEPTEGAGDKPDQSGDDQTTDTSESASGSRAVGTMEPTVSVSREQPDQPRPGPHRETLSRETVRGYVFWAAFGLLGLFTAMTLAGFYTSVQAIIDTWITEDYQPIFMAVFNLVMALACLVGLSLLARQVSATADEGTKET